MQQNVSCKESLLHSQLISILANVQFTDVLSYASKLSKYTSAPPNFDTMNKDVKIDFEKPYPDEERMRRGALYWQNTPQQDREERCKYFYNILPKNQLFFYSPFSF
jgi:hypothetical protein